MTPTKEILESIENRLRELNEEIGTLNAARAALDGHGSGTPKGPRRTAAGKAGPARSDDAGTHVAVEVAVAPAGQVSTDAPGTAARKSRRPAQRRSRARAARAVEVVPAGKLELLVGTAGLSTSALAVRANADRDQVLTLLRELEAPGRIRRTGQRRATRWHAITDEERIQKRAAELAARSKPAS
jgi:hypothetical protein